MKKKFTLLIAVTALLIGSSGGKVWGQNATADWTQPTDDHTTHSIPQTSFAADNNFAAGETGTITPLTSGTAHGFGAGYNSWSPYAGQWSSTEAGNTGPYTRDMFAVGNGRITIGGELNTVATGMNQNGISSTTACSHYTYTNGINAGPVPSVPDGSGTRNTTGVPTYTKTTTITVNGSSKTSNAPWWLQQFYFMRNQWRYNYYTYSTVTGTGHTHTHTYAGPCGSGGTWCSNCCSHSTTPAHFRVQYAYTNPTGANDLNGTIVLSGGSHVRLDGAGAPGLSIGAGTLGGTTASLTLPAAHYTLMNDAAVDVSNITVANIAPLGTNAVMGIQTQYTGTNMQTNPAGGTILIGSATNAASQGLMFVQASTTATAPGGPRTFRRSVTANSLTSYLGYSLPLHGTANLGNYGDNHMNILVAAMLPATLGAGGLQVYNHAMNSNNLTFSDAYTTTVGGAGNMLIEAYGTLNFNAATDITGSATGNATINGGTVTINAAHDYAGSAAGDYGVYAFRNFTNPGWASLYAAPATCGTSVNAHTWTNPTNRTDRNYVYGADQDAQPGSDFNGTGNITVGGIAVAVAHAGTGDLRWEATNDISTATASTIGFTQNGTGITNWQAKNNISAGGNITFTIGATAGETYWQAEGNIATLAPVANITAFTLSAATPTAWQAGGNITTNNTIDFDNTGTGNVSWQAGNNITTNYIVTFDNTSTGNTMWYAKNNITTNFGPGPLGGDVTFTETGSGKTLWWAENGDITTNNHILFDHTGAAAGNDISWWAGTNIVVSGTNPAPTAPLNQAYFDYNTNNTIEWHSKNGFIRTNAQVDFNRTNLGAGYTYLHAGCNTFTPNNNIVIENIFNYTEPTGAAGRVTFYAENDILSNTVCDARSAPVTFTAGTASRTTTLWDAQRNINTKGRVDYLYSGATAMGNLTWTSRAGYIQTERPVNVRYSSNNKISFLAENTFSAPAFAAGAVPNANASGRRGNIHMFDSLWIVRDNAGVGLTEIKAENHIWTAMVDYEDQASTGNSLEVTSHMGDIYLGHNDGTTDNIAYPFYLSSSAYAATPNFLLTQENPSLGCAWPPASPASYDLNRFNYTVNANNQTGHLHIKAGYSDRTDTGVATEGGNIYFTHINERLASATNHNTEISIPFSNWYMCDHGTHGTRDYYEKAGIIGGVGRCAITIPQPTGTNTLCADTGLIYYGFNGELLVDAGTRGNIIINNGAYLNFQSGTGNTKFLTRWGDIDMRYPFDVDGMQGGLLFLANSELANKWDTGNCGCEEKRNNVYLQDFKYNPLPNSGSIFIGADNNIKIQYGGLKNIDTQRDPFFSNNAGYPCGTNFHCDSDTTENQARDLILNFGTTTSGGFAAVASDLIDVYKRTVYIGGSGSGMSTVPTYGSLHGESVAGYGLYIKTQANKKNWDHNAFGIEIDACWPPKCDDPCTYSILQNVARVTFHSDARIYTEDQRTYIGSPVLNTFGNLELNTHRNKGGKTSIAIQTDSLIVHDSLIIDGSLTRFTTWSGLYRDMPIIKLGHQRFTPPFTEDGSVCAPCFIHEQTTGSKANRTAVDTIVVSFRNGASVDRLHTLVADHAVVTFQTDSFDHIQGDPVLNAKFYTDTFKIRNHVELYGDARREHDGHFELVSEEQMDSKDYAGIYSRHLHMEPIGPECSDYAYSQLWLQDPALDVITTSTFGGYGWLHADVHVEIEARLAPGFASLGNKGNYCYELSAGTLKMQDLRLDKGSELHYSIGHQPGLYGELVDCIDVDELTLYGDVNIHVEKRCGQAFVEGCYRIIRYGSVAIDTVNLNNLKLATKSLDGYMLSLDTSEPGSVYLCVGSVGTNPIRRQVLIPSVPGVTTDPVAGAHYVYSQNSFDFTAKYTTEQPLKVMTNRMTDGKAEELVGRLNAKGEYEYIIRQVTQNIVLTIGPDFATSNGLVDGTAVWSHDNTIYIRVEQEDIASIYSVTGQLVKRINLPQGSTPIPMERGVYIVTLKDGSIHKVILK